MKVCPVCNGAVEGRLDKVYCSDRCYKRAYYDANREALLKMSKQYYKDNREKSAEYRRINKTKISEYQKEYMITYQTVNRKRISEQRRGYREANRERIAEGNRIWYECNRKKVLERMRVQYRRGVGVPEEWDLSKETNIEFLMRLWLLSYRVEYEAQKRIDLRSVGGTWTVVDFFIPEINTCLYCDGDYWHSLEDVSRRDEQINGALGQMGYGVIRASGFDIRAGQWPIGVLEMLEHRVGRLQE